MSQSNTSLLDEVMQWSQETCRQELKSVLPKLTISSGSVLKVITDMFLPHMGLSELEDGCFSKILPKVVTMFEGMIKEILDQVGGLSSQNTELCGMYDFYLKKQNQQSHLLLSFCPNMLTSIIDALSTCVRHVCTFEEAPDLDAIRSLPTCILKVLTETFNHCKESEMVYCGRLSLVADLLQGLFKEAYSLQKALLELLDRIPLDSSASEEAVSDTVTVIHNLLDICSIISNLDIALHANTWKFLIKHSLKYQSLVEEHLHHGDISNSLCENLLVSFNNCVELAEQIKHAGLQESTQSPEYKLFQKTAKMCRFFANTLVHYIKEFKFFLTKYCNCYHRLYLHIISKFPPSLSAPTLPSALSEELSAAALVPMGALLLQLLAVRPFAEFVLQNDLRESNLPQCLLLLSVLGQIHSQPEEVLQLWHTGSQFSEEEPRLPLYQALFTSFRRCCAERRVPVLLPGVMMKGQAQVLVTLHSNICVQLCASVAALPPVFVPVLERCLLNTVLQSDTQTALLATDVWCFTARYGTAELCLHHVLLVAQLVKCCPAECYQSSQLGLLLRRMVFLMTPDHQTELVERFPPSEVGNLPVWRHVLLRALSQEARRRVEADITDLTEKCQSAFCLQNKVLFALLAVVRVQSSPEEPCVLSATGVITQLWLRMSPDQVQTHPVLQWTLQLLLSITAILVKSLDPQVIYQVCVVSQKCADQLLLAALEFLSSLGKIFFPPDSQNPILPKLSSLFAVLLADGVWLLQQHALEAFSQFAEVGQDLDRSFLKDVLLQTVNAQEDVESRLQRLKLETAVIEEHNERLELNKENASSKQTAEAVPDLEPCPKRARQEAGAEEPYSRYIQTAESALKALQALIAEGTPDIVAPPPRWLEPKLQELRTLITHISTAGAAT
uniref:Fignl1 interacting regulator of recombination and mitosis n=1 Tax=Gasterosteus aculeatus aculeatus TaxID=481459 RepID=A0AAQ4QLY9_GASAC